MVSFIQTKIENMNKKKKPTEIKKSEIGTWPTAEEQRELDRFSKEGGHLSDVSKI